VYPKITVSLKFLLFYPNPKGDKRNFKWVSVKKWDTPKNYVLIMLKITTLENAFFANQFILSIIGANIVKKMKGKEPTDVV
jgi:hypothetical protein